MSKNEIRQSSLILGAGPGAMTVLKDGSTVLIPGVDAWYITRKPPFRQVVPKDVVIHDPLLAENLNVSFFVKPPAQGISEEDDSDYIDVTLFPSWVVCYSCNALVRNVGPYRQSCSRCPKQGKKSRRLVQTNFVVACEDGHLDEFPWLEWVHRGAGNTCQNPELSFIASGVVELRSQRVKCSCGKTRDLSRTNNANLDGTTDLSLELEKGAPFLCSGAMPWMKMSNPNCTKHIRMVLRSSNNIYFASTVSSILVPAKLGSATEVAERILASKTGKYLAWLDTPPRQDYKRVALLIKGTESERFRDFTEEEIAKGLEEAFAPKANSVAVDENEVNPFDRSPEWLALIAGREDKDLVVRPVGGYQGNLFGIEGVNAVPLMRKTTALKGFTRINSRDISVAYGKQLMRQKPFGVSANWLPAIQQTGEGIFIKLQNEKVDRWLAEPSVQNRTKIILDGLEKNNRGISGVEASAKFFLLHTLAHTLIQELVISCGYTSAALTERIYSVGEQSGILIYTASASADGTMGGLVAMSNPEQLLNSLENAVNNARWCSNDPVCMEVGKSGHGNSGSNLAACHSCCLLPETACEHFNQGLDRAMLIGDTAGDSGLTGFFDFS